MIFMGWPLGRRLYDANYTWFELMTSISFKHDALDQLKKEKSMTIITNPILTQRAFSIQ